jgi:hypothetical protein
MNWLGIKIAVATGTSDTRLFLRVSLITSDSESVELPAQSLPPPPLLSVLFCSSHSPLIILSLSHPLQQSSTFFLKLRRGPTHPRSRRLIFLRAKTCSHSNYERGEEGGEDGTRFMGIPVRVPGVDNVISINLSLIKQLVSGARRGLIDSLLTPVK